MAVVALLALPVVAHAGLPQQLLPDLMQEAPFELQVGLDPESGHYALGFSSAVANVGAGPFEVHGIGPGNGEDMTAYQMIHMSDGAPTEQSADPIGEVHYEVGGNHDHWHFEPFDVYELHSLDGRLVAPDQKEGFCLVDGMHSPAGIPVLGDVPTSRAYVWPPDAWCYKGEPDHVEIREGISVGWADEYQAFWGGQDIDLTNVPAGRYYLVHRVNGTGKIKELNPQNDVATVTIDVTWPNGTDQPPQVSAPLRTCLSAATCPVPGPPPPPGPTLVAPDRSAPELLLGGTRRQRLLRGRSIFVYAKCDEACRITASGRIAALQVAKSLRTKTAKVRLKPGVRTKIKLRMSARTRKVVVRQLRRRARVIVRVSLVAVDGAGNRTSTQHRTLRLLPRPR